MKNLIVIIGTVMLGVAIFNMMVGSSDDSLRSVSRNIMIKNRYERPDHDRCSHNHTDGICNAILS